MRSVRAVVEYSGLSLPEALKLPVDMFMLCLKNWTVDRLMQTEEGRQYLDDCKRLSKTKMDREGLHRLMDKLSGKR